MRNEWRQRPERPSAWGLDGPPQLHGTVSSMPYTASQCISLRIKIVLSWMHLRRWQWGLLPQAAGAAR